MLTESQKGRIAQDLLGLTCVIGSLGKINVALPNVDDEAVDVVFYLRAASGKALFAQVKSRWISSVGIRKGVFRTQIRRATFKPRDNYAVIMVTCDQDKLGLGEILWVIPSLDFANLTLNQHSATRLVFQSRFGSSDMWEKYRLRLKDLPDRIVELLGEQRL